VNVTVKLNWGVLGSVVAALAGIAGSIITPVFGSHLAAQVQSVLQSLSGLLILIPSWHLGSVAAANAKATHAARLAVTKEAGQLSPFEA
jgi:hypothetical protein